jgi:prolycopene isomerase
VTSLTADVVVIGAGLGGMSAAGHLQAKGYDVVILEHHSKPGGYAHNFKKHGFRFEVALHALDGMQPGGWAYKMFDDLGALDGITYHQLEPFYTVAFDGIEIDVSTDLPEYIEAIGSVLPQDKERVAEMFDAIKRVGHDMARFTSDRRSGVKSSQAEMLDRYPEMAMAFATTWEQFLARFDLSREARAITSTLWGYLGLPPSRLSAGQMALVLLSYHSSGAWYPEGGSGAMTRAIARKFTDRGGEILYRHDVVSIEPKGPTDVTVTTHKGLTVHAKAVVSNASPYATMAMLPESEIAADFVSEVDAETPSVSSLVVYLGLDRDVGAEDGWLHHEFFEMATLDIEAEYEAIMRGDFTHAGMIVSNYTLADPECAPDGGSVLTITTLAPWDYADIWGTGGDLTDYSSNKRYIELKNAVGETLIDRLERRIPNLRESIVVKEIGTPLTNVRYALQPGGSIYGREQTVMNQMNRRRPTTPVANLFLAGAWVGGGGMTACVGSGKGAASAAHRYLSTEGVD